jgi:hypothetical protein
MSNSESWCCRAGTSSIFGAKASICELKSLFYANDANDGGRTFPENPITIYQIPWRHNPKITIFVVTSMRTSNPVPV